MNVFEIHHGILPAEGFANTAISSATNTDSAEVDSAGYEALEFLWLFGAIADTADITLELHHSDTQGFTPDSSTLVSSDETLGQTTVAGTDDNKVARLGYIGKKRYVIARLVTGNADAVNVSCTSLLASPHHAPVADAPN
jgi:hypothetical protein